MTRTLSYIELPVLLKWAPNRESGFRIGGGLSLGFITGAHDRYEATTPSQAEYVLEQDIDDQVNSPDLGLALDVEWRFPMLAIAARYTHGLTDIARATGGGAIQTRTITGTGRIYLGKRRAPADTASRK